MHLFRFNKDIISFVGVLFFFSIIVNLNGCSQKKVEKKTETVTIAEHDWTDTIVGPLYVRMHEPMPGGNPGPWAGPVEIGKKPGIFSCTIHELIKGVRLGKHDNILIIEAYNGSERYDIEANVDSCKIIQKIKIKSIEK
jgi:hypothetical protein